MSAASDPAANPGAGVPRWLLWGGVGGAALLAARWVGRRMAGFLGAAVALGALALVVFPEVREPFQKLHRLVRGVGNGLRRVFHGGPGALRSLFAPVAEGSSASGQRQKPPAAGPVPSGEAGSVPSRPAAPEARSPAPAVPPSSGSAPVGSSDTSPPRPVAGRDFGLSASPPQQADVPSPAPSRGGAASTFRGAATASADETLDAVRLTRIAESGNPHDFLKALRRFADQAGDAVRIGGRGARILSVAGRALGPVGLALVAWEVLDLEQKAQAAVADGRMTDVQFYAYQGILGSHAAQCGLDPTLFGGEALVQTAYEQFAGTSGIAKDKTLLEELRPSSLLRMIGVLGEPDPDKIALRIGRNAWATIHEFPRTEDIRQISRDLVRDLDAAGEEGDLDRTVRVSGELVDIALADVDARLKGIAGGEFLNRVNEARGVGNELTREAVLEMVMNPAGRRELENLNAVVRTDMRQFVNPLLHSRHSLTLGRGALDALGGKVTPSPTGRLNTGPSRAASSQQSPQGLAPEPAG
ncbi:MAG: hypothetical protein EOM26_04505 [Alphaproteobacteria bacterium]|nr:hypothetical protein [Alphaproteobacteria bacterium]